MKIKKGKFTVIAGACSAENEEQILHLADKFQFKGGVDYLRAGLWKPRTRPGQFEGVGKDGFNWLKKARKNYKAKIAIEVGSVLHARSAVLNDVDLIWIGARTSGDPFTVENIAKQIRYVCEEFQKPLPIIAVKNPIFPDVEAWIGAVERFQVEGFEVIAIHRGFKTRNKNYRNEPLWALALEFKERLRDIPLLIDPSHIVGNRDLFPVTATAIAFGYDGIMIEVHPNPANALTDQDQQINVEDFYKLLGRLKEVRKEENYSLRIEAIRSEVDSIDYGIIDSIVYRKEITERIGTLKRDAELPIEQPGREQAIVEGRKNNARIKGLNPELVEPLFNLIVKECRDNQTKAK